MKKEVKNNVNIHKTKNKQDTKIKNRPYQKSVRMCWKVSSQDDCRAKTRPPDVKKNINLKQ